MNPLELHTKTEFIPSNKIVKNDWNPNFVNESLMRAIKDDIQKNGFIGTIVLQKHNKKMNCDNVIINGEHRYIALTEFGITEIPSIVLDVDDDTAKILTIRLNREHGEFMPDKLVTLLHDLDSNFDLDALNELTAMDKSELEILKTLDISDSDLLDDKPELDDSDTKPTWNHIEKWITILSKKIANVFDGGILAVTTGGVVPAALLARDLRLDMKLLPMSNRQIDTSIFQQSPSYFEKGKCYLIVDDIYDTGKTFKNINETLTKLAPDSIFQYAFLTVRAKNMDTNNNDISFGKQIFHEKYVLFPWELET